MKRYLMLAALSSLAISALSIHAADLSKYGDFQVGRPLADIAEQSDPPQSAVNLLSSRPERIQEPDWRIGWRPSSSDAARVPFGSYHNALCQISVSYDRGRNRGLTESDRVESISSVYGAAAPVSGTKTPDTSAQREDTATLKRLVPLPYCAGFGLVLSSKATMALAEQAILESARTDRIDTPRIEAALQAKRLADSQLADEKARLVTTLGFRT